MYTTELNRMVNMELSPFCFLVMAQLCMDFQTLSKHITTTTGYNDITIFLPSIHKQSYKLPASLIALLGKQLWRCPLLSIKETTQIYLLKQKAGFNVSPSCHSFFDIQNSFATIDNVMAHTADYDCKRKQRTTLVVCGST